MNADKSTSRLAVDRRSRRVARTAIMAAMIVPAIFATGLNYASAATIALHQTAAATGPNITLAEVADLHGTAAGALGAAVMGHFAAGDKTVSISMAQVQKALTAANVNWGDVSLSGYMTCQVTREQAAAQPLTNYPKAKSAPLRFAAKQQTGVITLKDRLNALITRMAGVKPDHLRIDYSDHDAKLLADTAIGQRVSFEPTAGSAIGRLPVIVREYQGGQLDTTFAVMATVAEHLKAVVATESVPRGTLLTSRSLAIKPVWLTNDRGRPMTSLAQVEGQAANTLIRPGDVIYPDLIKAPTLVQRGQMMTVRCISGALVVRTSVRAEQSGARGDVIKVRNPSSRQAFMVTVTGPQQGIIRLGDPSSERAATVRERGSASSADRSLTVAARSNKKPNPQPQGGAG